MAQHTPNGIAKAAVSKVSITVPMIGVKIPPLDIPSVGTCVTKSQESTPAPLTTISQMMTTKKKITNKVLSNREPHSTTLVSLDVLNCMIFSKAVNKIFSQHVRNQGHKEQHRRNRIQLIVMRRLIRHLAHFDRNRCGHGFDRIKHSRRQ